jgi:hypothetical protein
MAFVLAVRYSHAKRTHVEQTAIRICCRIFSRRLDPVANPVFTAAPLVGAASLSGIDSSRAEIVCLLLLVGEQILAFKLLKGTTAPSAAIAEIRAPMHGG